MDDKKLDDFLNELTALSQKYGLGITDDSELYELEAEDSERRYRCDDDSRLAFV